MLNNVDYQSIIAFLAIKISIISFGFSFYFFKRNKYIAKQSANLVLITQTQIMQLKNPVFIKFHNVTENLLKECYITCEEFAYILLTFYAGKTYYYIDGKKYIKNHLPYRQNLLFNEKVKNIWEKSLKIE